MSRPLYTSSRLFVFDIPSGSRRFFPASAKPRWVVGVRSYCAEELPYSPFNANVPLPPLAALRGDITLIDAFTVQPIVRGLPVNRVNMFAIRTATKALVPTADGTTNPLLFPLAMPRRCTLAGSWVNNVTRNPIRVAIEVFFNDPE